MIRIVGREGVKNDRAVALCLIDPTPDSFLQPPRDAHANQENRNGQKQARL